MYLSVESIANLLHCHLGIHDPSEGRDKTVDMRNAEQTSAEKFRSFCDVRSRAWHARRDEAAQRCKLSTLPHLLSERPR